jgi:hypothetical protein
MSSFAAFYMQGSESELLPGVDEWVLSLGFAKKRAFSAPPSELLRFHLGVHDFGFLTLNPEWCILYLNGFTLPGRVPVGLKALEPLAARCARRSLLFVAQTTSDCYELAAFDRARCVRHLMYADGARLEDTGERLPGEEGDTFAPISEDEEQPSPMDDATAICRAQGFELWSDLHGPGYIWGRRGLFARLFGHSGA